MKIKTNMIFILMTVLVISLLVASTTAYKNTLQIGQNQQIDDGEYVELCMLMTDGFAGGTGSLADPYQISNWTHLNNVRNQNSKNFILNNNLDSGTDGFDMYASSSANSGAGWEPINSGSPYFSGTFNGDNYTISDLYINRPSANYVGLFGYTDGASIRYLGVDNVDITGNMYVGGFAGAIWNSDVSSCNSTGSVHSSSNIAGGFAGTITSSSIDGCYSTGSVTSDGGYVGGFAGGISSSSVDSCNSASSVVGAGERVGGFAGIITSSSVVSNCYSTGNAVGTGDRVGGFAGEITGFSVEVSSCYSTGSVEGDGERVGGFAGSIGSFSDVSSCYSTGSVEGDGERVGGFAGTIGGNSSVDSCYSTGGVIGASSRVGGFAGAIWNSDVSSCNSTGNVHSSSNIAGGFAGTITSSSIDGCYSTSSVNGSGHFVGGFAGTIGSNSSVDSCYSTGSVTGSSTSVGGFAGTITISYVHGCYSTSSVNGSSSHVGGFAGRITTFSVVSDCYSTGSVTLSSGTDDRVGGFVGQNHQSNITNSYSTGSVHYTNADDPTDKGFCGSVDTDGAYHMNGNFWDMQTSGQTSTSGNAIGKTTFEMKSLSTFTNASWDISYSTADLNDGYPFLAWQNNTDDVVWLLPKSDLIEITTWEDLHNMRNDLSGNYILMNNLDSSTEGYYIFASSNANEGQGWLPISSYTTPSFSGTFNGQNYTISDLYINRSSNYNIGLFGKTSEAIICNIGLIDADIMGEDYVGGLIGGGSAIVSNSYTTGTVTGANRVGGLIGILENGSASNCYATGDVTGINFVGGFAGWISDFSVVTDCYATGTVAGTAWYVGGFAGFINGSSVDGCYSTGSVHGSSNIVGGFAGRISTSSVVKDCYSTGSVTGGGNSVGGFAGAITSSSIVTDCYCTGSVNGSSSHVGGFAGRITTSSVVSDCYSTGSVTLSSGTDDRVGGFVGQNHQSNITNSYSTGSVHYTNADDPTDKGFCGSVDTDGAYHMSGNFWDIDTSGQTSTAGNATGKTTTKMKDFDTFDTAGWDISYSNVDLNNGYPYLSWQNCSFGYDWLIFESFDVNDPPFFVNPCPSNNSINQDVSFIWNITIIDPDSDFFNWSIECSNGQFNSGFYNTDGIKSLDLSELAYSTTYIIWVNATDPTGSGLYTRAWYSFTTKEQNEYILSLSVEPEDGGYITIDPNPPYYYGTLVTLTAYENPGYSFSHWSGDLAGNVNPEFLFIDANKMITAHFTMTIPSLSCTGSLNWADVKPGATVTGEFTVQNIGDPESLLNWEIQSYPSWGSWTFTPSSGVGLTPEDGAVIVTVEVVAPMDNNTEFSGEIVLVNIDDPDDNCFLEAILITNDIEYTELVIENIKAPILHFLNGVIISVKNAGTLAAENVVINMNISGGLFGMVNKEIATRTITTFDVGSSISISSSLVVGIGPIEIVIKASADNADEVTVKRCGFLIGPFILGL